MEKKQPMSYMKQIHDFKVSSYDLGGAAGLSWPPRSYVCTFCKREFRSAQALGGHMNVHRRDRARLRHSPATNAAAHFSHPSSLNLNLQPNPSFFTKVPQFMTCSKLPQCGGDAVPAAHHPLTADLMKLRDSKGAARGAFESSSTLRKIPEFVSLELEMGLRTLPCKDELDLELRLGF